MIVFRNFNLFRLLSLQVAPASLGVRQPGSNAFFKLSECAQTGQADLLRVSGGSCARGHGFFPLSTRTKTQSTGQNGRNHDHFYKFQASRLLSSQAASPV
jgi:hypothetical protein